MKLKHVDPELLCKEPDPANNQQSDETGYTGVLEPSSIRSKPDATTVCFTYHYPQIQMDCSNRGKLSALYPPLLWAISWEVYHMCFCYVREGLGKIPATVSMLMIKYCCCLAGTTKQLTQRIFTTQRKTSKHARVGLQMCAYLTSYIITL